MHKSLLLLFLHICFLSLTLNAQNSVPKLYAIKSDTAFETILDSTYLQVLEDKTGVLRINQVSAALFLPYATGMIKPGNVVWFRYRIKNDLAAETGIGLDSRVAQSDFYVYRNSRIPKHFVTGFLYPRNKKDGLKKGNIIPVLLQPGEEILVYHRMYNGDAALPKNFRVDFVNTEKEIRREFDEMNGTRNDHFYFQHLLEAFVVGLLFLTLFFNLFFYKVVHEKINLHFALFAFFLGLNRLYNILSELFLWERPQLLVYVKCLGYAWAFIIYFLIQFIREFFGTKKLYPKWDKWLKGLVVFNFCWHIMRFVSPLPGNNIIHLLNRLGLMALFLIIPLSILVTIGLFLRKKDTAVRLVIAGTAPLMLLYTMDLNESLGIPIPALLNNLIDNFRLIEVMAICWLVLFFSWTLFIRYDNLKKENAQRALDNERLAREKETQKNELIKQQKAELEQQVAQRTLELATSLENLRATQTQLIQAEKMASLGELTAGIAHEIQNPLNFVNNFSELNKELLLELKLEISQGNLDEVKILATDIEANEEKINHHGKRADAIVKGMLQHSRHSKGQKELVDINELTEEYIRLCFHGIRTRDKLFTATIKTSFDQPPAKISIVPQEIGSVLMNVLANAFYAVNEKHIMATASGNAFESIVYIDIKRTADLVHIIIKDNGNGIPEKIRTKIFQPFFTTKPAGQGTGLGLSLSYDIVKAHGGELSVETKEGEGTAFTITLPAR